MRAAYLSIGGNMGEKRENLRKALILIHEAENIRLGKVSSFYETAPWGKTDQPPFLNAAAKIFTSLSPNALLKTLQNIENKMGRIRKEHWGERIIDIDIIHFEGENTKNEFLTLPHPYFSKRNFVLKPLFEIEPKLVINDIPLKTHLTNCKDNLPAKKTKGSPKDFKMTAIAAVDKDFGIGYDNKLLFKIKCDLDFFRENTLNEIIIMGKNTFWETGALTKRKIIVLSRSEDFSGKNIYTANSVLDLFNLLDTFNKNNEKKIFIAGGGAVYSLLLPYAEFLTITYILGKRTADAFFPPIYDFSLKEMRFGEEKGLKFAFARYLK